MLSDIATSIFSLDTTLAHWVSLYGPRTLWLVALVIFAETGLVVAPFLPGDSLLFLTGTIAATAALNVHLAVAVLIAAAVLGDAVNFAVGRHAAPFVMRNLGGRWLRQSHLDATHRYFAHYGAATIVLARFVPIVRTLAPFLAGAGTMSYGRFAVFNVLGAAIWVAALVYAGAFFGELPFVKDHLSLATLTIVVVSVLPAVVTALRAGSSSKQMQPTDLKPPKRP